MGAISGSNFSTALYEDAKKAFDTSNQISDLIHAGRCDEAQEMMDENGYNDDAESD